MMMMSWWWWHNTPPPPIYDGNIFLLLVLAQNNSPNNSEKSRPPTNLGAVLAPENMDGLMDNKTTKLGIIFCVTAVKVHVKNNKMLKIGGNLMGFSLFSLFFFLKNWKKIYKIRSNCAKGNTFSGLVYLRHNWHVIGTLWQKQIY